MTRLLIFWLATLLVFESLLFGSWVYLGCSVFDLGGDPIISCRFGIVCTPTFQCDRLP